LNSPRIHSPKSDSVAERCSATVDSASPGAHPPLNIPVKCRDLTRVNDADAKNTLLTP